MRNVQHEQIYVDDQPLLDEQIENQEFYWALTRGDHKFYIKQGDKISNFVQIKVL